MTARQRNNAAETRGRPFPPGNPGRPKGARHRVTVAVEILLEGDAEALTRKAIELGLAGDLTALRLCLDRIAPARRDRPVVVDLPALDTADDGPRALAAIAAAAACGEITPGEALALAGVVVEHRRGLETVDIERRIAALEARHGQ